MPRLNCRKPLIALSVSALMLHPVTAGAQSDTPLADRLERLEREAEGLSERAEETVQEFLKLIGPMIERFSGMIDDLPAYEAPEILPNGDIIIRRKPDPDSLPSGPATPDATET